MNTVIITSSKHKKKELTHYFDEINIPTLYFKNYEQFEEKRNSNEEYLVLQEQTTLLNKKTKKSVVDFALFQEVIHKSELKISIVKNEMVDCQYYQSKVEGYLVPHKRNKSSVLNSNIYNWDDIFVPKNSNLTYQEMKEKGIKNSARDLVFALFAEENEDIFKLKNKVDLNFNKVNTQDVISFEPFVSELFKNNQYYKVCHKNYFLNNVVEHVIYKGLFVKKAENRSQKNYWLPGLNAGLPLVAKKDEIHELTFMFHDLMHFIYPDLIVTDLSESSKRKYIISRMMSEAITIVLADMFFVSLLSKNNVEYDFSKRKIFPLFDNLKFQFEINGDNFKEMKGFLWEHVVFALLGDETLLRLAIKNQKVFDDYKEKYQPFFKEDYIWTEKNYQNMLGNVDANKIWYDEIKSRSAFNVDLKSAEEYLSGEFEQCRNLTEEVRVVFEEMMKKLKNYGCYQVYPTSSPKLNAFRSYMLGQINIFYKYDPHYNDIFKDAIYNELNNVDGKSDDEIISEVREIYELYLSKLVEDKLITNYRKDQYKNIYPMFSPFYVFYDRNNDQTFSDVLNSIFN